MTSPLMQKVRSSLSESYYTLRFDMSINIKSQGYNVHEFLKSFQPVFVDFLENSMA